MSWQPDRPRKGWTLDYGNHWRHYRESHANASSVWPYLSHWMWRADDDYGNELGRGESPSPCDAMDEADACYEREMAKREST